MAVKRSQARGLRSDEHDATGGEARVLLPDEAPWQGSVGISSPGAALSFAVCCCATRPDAAPVADRVAGWRAKSPAKSISLRVLRVHRGERHLLTLVAKTTSCERKPY